MTHKSETNINNQIDIDDTVESVQKNSNKIIKNNIDIYNSQQYLNTENVKIWSVNMKTADMKNENDDLRIVKRIIFIKTFVIDFDCQQAWFDNVMYQ